MLDTVFRKNHERRGLWAEPLANQPRRYRCRVAPCLIIRHAPPRTGCIALGEKSVMRPKIDGTAQVLDQCRKARRVRDSATQINDVTIPLELDARRRKIELAHWIVVQAQSRGLSHGCADRCGLSFTAAKLTTDAEITHVLT